MAKNEGASLAAKREFSTSIKRKFAETLNDCNGTAANAFPTVSYSSSRTLVQSITEIAEKTNVLVSEPSVPLSETGAICNENLNSYEKMEISSQESLGGTQSMLISSQENELNQKVANQENCSLERSDTLSGKVDISNQGEFDLKKNKAEHKFAEFSGSESVHSYERMDISSQESLAGVQIAVTSNQQTKSKEKISPKKADGFLERNTASYRETVSRQDELGLKINEADHEAVTSSQETLASYTEEHLSLGNREKNVSRKRKGILTKKEKWIASREEAVAKREHAASLREKALLARENAILYREKALLHRETRLLVILADKSASGSFKVKRKKSLALEN